MKKVMNDLTGKSLSELEKESMALKAEMGKAQLDAVVNAPKDTNLISKKKQKLAQIETVLTQKRSEAQTK
jgi:ribosomal protein L29